MRTHALSHSLYAKYSLLYVIFLYVYIFIYLYLYIILYLYLTVVPSGYPEIALRVCSSGLPEIALRDSPRLYCELSRRSECTKYVENASIKHFQFHVVIFCSLLAYFFASFLRDFWENFLRVWTVFCTTFAPHFRRPATAWQRLPNLLHCLHDFLPRIKPHTSLRRKSNC